MGVSPGVPETAARVRRVHEQLVDDLYRRAVVSQVGFAVALAILASLVLGTGGLPARVVLGFLAALVVLRLALVALDRSPRTRLRSARSREVAFLVGVTLTSAALGALNVVAYPGLPPAQSALLGACETGAIAAGLASLGSSALGFALYSVPNLGALIVMVALDRRGWGENTFLALLCIYLPAVLLVSVQQYRVRRRSAELEIELGELALRDALTGLFNRRFFDAMLDKEAAVAENSCRMQDRRKPLSATALGLLVLDLDHFKSVNDVHGHAAGDAVLREVAGRIKGCLRLSDEAVRWGGEEFVIVLRLPWDDRGEIARIADRLLASLRERLFELGGGVELRCTASVGYALHPLSNHRPNILPWAATLELADAALYLAKHEGRDRAVGVVAGPGLEAHADEAAAVIAQGLDPAVEAGLLRVVRPS